MLNAGVPASFEDVEKADDVAVDVHVGILERVADARLSRKVNDALRPFARKEIRYPASVGDIELDEPESGVRREPREARLLQGNVVVVVEVIEAENVVAARKEPLRDVHPDESRCARDEDFQMTVPCVSSSLAIAEVCEIPTSFEYYPDFQETV
jgi:hypothetical protein